MPSRPDLEITSPANPRLKQLVGLRRRRARDEAGVTVVEGFEELELVLDAGVRPRTLFYCPELMLDADAQMGVVEGARSAGVETVRVGRAAFEKVAYREGPDGFLALVPSVRAGLADLDLPEAPLLLVCEGLEKPGNLGAMLRTADAAGVDAVIAVDPVTDWGNPNVVRGSKGTVFSVAVASATLDETLQWLGENGIRLIATTPDTETLHTDADLTGGIAIAVGTEKFGLTDEALRAAEVRVRIPMHGQVNSLNASAAAAIVVYEAVRQRG
ncbi:TrmH family RNA methyltransferase [Knoellia subterranea]|uniref:rRNA methyltransferase n=1 Tax=Knoellia subterranea KCTC 19937 TaxID=1385521 RepID=A0A0A0JK65_9MICO|nr:RNA methyltransferase [Knoellia subterranea]KGN37159.1 rRNA methyltransferase [Knoellia subterranea KCTC 19937]